MATALLDRPGLPDHARADGSPAILSAILMPGINLAVWQRDRLPALPAADLLDTIDDIDLTCAADELCAAMREALAEAGYPATMVTDLARDITALGGRLADLLDQQRLSVRLEVVETDACRRFHADYVSVRLICTYAGVATQWLADADAAALREGANPATLPIRQLDTGDVALFKGREWTPDGAIVHRSPPIAGTGERRLMLVIDPAPTDDRSAAIGTGAAPATAST